MKQEIIKRLKIYFLNSLFRLGFLTNFGLVAFAYLGYFILADNFALSLIWKLNSFVAFYLVFYFIIRKEIKNLKNDFFEAGFVFASIIISLLIVTSYAKLFLSLLP